MKRTRLRRQSAKRTNEAVKLAELRLFVLERDGYRCVNCRTRGVALDVHHIQKRSQRPDLLLEPTNVVTLCRVCHNWTDAAPQSKEGRLIVENYGGAVTFWVDHEGKYARMQRQAGGVFLSQTANHMVIPNDAQESTA